MTKVNQRRHRLGDEVRRLIHLHRPSDADLTALSELLATLAALEATGALRWREMSDSIETWIAEQQ
jgi:hypothetical protein